MNLDLKKLFAKLIFWVGTMGKVDVSVTFYE